MLKFQKQKLFPLILAVLMVVADQVSKYLAVRFVPPAPEFMTVIPGVLDFRYLTNDGAAFGLFADQPWIFMTLTSIVILVFLFVYFFRDIRSSLLQYAMMLIVAGGVGNMIDRVASGAVVDFINFTFLKFYVFNVADCCVVIGCCLLALYMVLDLIREYKRKKPAPSNDPGDADA